MRALRLALAAAAGAAFLAADAGAQIPVTHRDINPNQSTLDPADPDGAR